MTPEIIKMIEKSDDVFGGVEGDMIDWVYPEGHLFKAYGIKPVSNRPIIGDLLAAEFLDAWLQVEVKDIFFDQPADGYFLLEVVPVQRLLKAKASAVKAPPRPFRFVASP